MSNIYSLTGQASGLPVFKLGGVPRKITSDNPKCFSLEASKFEPLLNPAFDRFCDYYGIVPEMLPPRSPEKKGKVERVVPYIRRLFESYGEWQDIKSAQEHLDKKIALANERKHGTTKLRPIDDFLLQEALVLKSLPLVSFEMEEYHQGAVRADGHVRFRGKYYSVEESLRGKDVFIIGNSKTVQIYHKGKLLETHPRITNFHQSKSTKSCHLKPYERIIRDSDHYIDKARKIGPNVEELIRAILLSGNGFVDTRKVWGILGLDKEHSKENIDKACKDTLS